jgi:hypothetical protein
MLYPYERAITLIWKNIVIKVFCMLGQFSVQCEWHVESVSECICTSWPWIYIYILNSLFLASFAFWISVRRGAYSFKKEIDNFTGILSGGRRWIISVTSKEEGRLIDFLCIPLHYWLYRAKKERDVVGRWMESGHNCCIIV